MIFCMGREFFFTRFTSEVEVVFNARTITAYLDATILTKDSVIAEVGVADELDAEGAARHLHDPRIVRDASAEHDDRRRLAALVAPPGDQRDGEEPGRSLEAVAVELALRPQSPPAVVDVLRREAGHGGEFPHAHARATCWTCSRCECCSVCQIRV